jgi:hypothetical protein
MCARGRKKGKRIGKEDFTLGELDFAVVVDNGRNGGDEANR